MDQSRTPKDESRALVYRQAYAAVLNNPHWYRDGPQLLDERFNAETTRRRADILVDILVRAAQRRTNHHLSHQLFSLADKLNHCHLDRCGSSACPQCLRAFQQAKTVAHRRLIYKLAAMHPNALLCLITIIPLELNYPQATLQQINASEFNLHLKNTLVSEGLIRPFLGSIDFSLEPSRLQKYWQPHWHFSLQTSDPQLLRERLKELFPPINKHDYPVDVKEAVDLEFIPYIHKGVKLNALLRTGRTHLPELLLVLDRINPLDLMVSQGLVLSAQDDGFNFELLNSAAEGRNSKSAASNDHAFANGRVGPSRSKRLSAIRPVPRRGLSREEAAMYIGISTGKFDELVRTGRMPGPKRIDGRKVWDVVGLDAAFDELPSEGNSWADV